MLCYKTDIKKNHMLKKFILSKADMDDMNDMEEVGMGGTISSPMM